MLAYRPVLERQSLSGERATSESKKLGELASHGSSGDDSSSSSSINDNSGGCGSGSTGWIVAAGWAATVVASRLAGLRVATGGD